MSSARLIAVFPAGGNGGECAHADGAKAVPTFLCVIIGDHSRLIPFAAYFLRADTHAFHQTLKEALRRRGLPAKLYTDHGGPFTNDQIQKRPHRN